MTRPQPFHIEGVLTHRVFPGPPNYEDIRQGDKPEPAYILHLQQSICASGDDFVDPKRQIDDIQIYPADANDPALWRQLRKLVGKPVAVEGSAPFGAHTGHHHAPLLLPIKKVALANRRR